MNDKEVLAKRGGCRRRGWLSSGEERSGYGDNGCQDRPSNPASDDLSENRYEGRHQKRQPKCHHRGASQECYRAHNRDGLLLHGWDGPQQVTAFISRRVMDDWVDPRRSLKSRKSPFRAQYNALGNRNLPAIERIATFKYQRGLAFNRQHPFVDILLSDIAESGEVTPLHSTEISSKPAATGTPAMLEASGWPPLFNSRARRPACLPSKHSTLSGKHSKCQQKQPFMDAN